MVTITLSTSSRSLYFRVFISLIIVTCLTTCIVIFRSWRSLRKPTYLSTVLTADESFFMGTERSSSIEEHFRNISRKARYYLQPLTKVESFFLGIGQNSAIKELLRNSSRQVKVKGVDCAAIFKGSDNETVAARTMVGNASSPLSDSLYLNLTQNCEHFQKQRGYIMSSLTDEEQQFPLAYSLMVFKDSEMVERLLRAIYRPHNLYCIHVDKKATNAFFKSISAISNCFTNVFLASRRMYVEWGFQSVLQSEIVCMEDLWKYRQWKYLINLTGQEFPLKTNHELVKILNHYQGAVDVVSSLKILPWRFPKRSPPHGLRITKGSVHVVVNREFVDFILHNQTSKDLLNWTMGTRVPDETFFAMLNGNPQLGIKGTYKGQPEFNPGRPSFARYKSWRGMPCSGRRARNICILSTGDLPLLGESPMMFANKFYLHQDRVVIGCLEEKIFNNTRDEYMGTKIFNTTAYQNLTFVKNKIE